MFFNFQSLASAIAATKVLSAQQVVKNEAGEEVSGDHKAHILTVCYFDCPHEIEPRIESEFTLSSL